MESISNQVSGVPKLPEMKASYEATLQGSDEIGALLAAFDLQPYQRSNSRQFDENKDECVLDATQPLLGGKVSPSKADKPPKNLIPKSPMSRVPSL